MSYTPEQLMHRLIDLENSMQFDYRTLACVCQKLCGSRYYAIFVRNTNNDQNETVLSSGERLKMLHALGWSHTPKLSKLGWRNYYICEHDSDMEHLVELGFARKHIRHESNEGYSITESGMRKIGMSEHSIKKLKVKS